MSQKHVEKTFSLCLTLGEKCLSRNFAKSLTETNVDRGRMFAENFQSVQLYHISSWSRQVTSFSQHNTYHSKYLSLIYLLGMEGKEMMVKVDLGKGGLDAGWIFKEYKGSLNNSLTMWHVIKNN